MDAGVTQNALPELVVESLRLPQASRMTGYEYTSGVVWLLAPKCWASTWGFSIASGCQGSSPCLAKHLLLAGAKVW